MHKELRSRHEISTFEFSTILWLRGLLFQSEDENQLLVNLVTADYIRSNL